MRSAAKIWELLPHDPAAVDRLARELSLSSIVAQLLHNRGLGDAATARRFLDASLTGLHAPELLPDIPQAAERLYQASRARNGPSNQAESELREERTTGEHAREITCRHAAIVHEFG